jgi:hypothetical protein
MAQNPAPGQGDEQPQDGRRAGQYL